MLFLPCPGLALLLDAAYRHFSEVSKFDDGMRHFEQALSAPAPDNKVFRDYSPAQGWRSCDEPIAALYRMLHNLVEEHVADLGRVLLPLGPALRSLLGDPDRHVLRLSSYPSSDERLLNHPHADIDLFTLLPAASVGGLEIEGSGGWRAASTARDEVLVITGEFTQMFGGMAAVRHRVRATGAQRVSASFFVNAAPDLVVGGRSVGEIFAERLVEVGRRP